jgi:pilus assembly protein CpaC
MTFRGPLAWAALALCALPFLAPAQDAGPEVRDLYVTVGKSIVVDSPRTIQRVSIANDAIAEVVAATPREVILIGKATGETTLILWQEGGTRLFFDVHIRSTVNRLERVRQELSKEFGPQTISLSLDGDNVYLRGIVSDTTAAERAVAIATTLGKPVNLLNIKTPPVDPQILLKVRFADISRAAGQELGVNLFSTGGANTIGGITTGQFQSGRVQPETGGAGGSGGTFTLADALNIFLYRPDLNIGAAIKALESKRMLQILAEPNLLTINGKTASFLAGGEFPYPNLQGGGAGLGAVTIQFREFGVRINFTPTVTPRGTIRLTVTPEVSSLDYANGLIFQGFNIPGLATRRVSTEVELEDGQSFGIGGLLDNRVTEQLNKIPGLGDIPFLGALFKSRQINKQRSELLVIVSPELVRPIPAGQPLPPVNFPKEWLKDPTSQETRTPGMDKTGPVPVKSATETVPYEKMKEMEGKVPAAAPPGYRAPVEFVPMTVPLQVQPGQSAPAAAPAPARPSPNGGGSGQ